MELQESIRERLAQGQNEVRTAALAELLQSGADPSPYVEELGRCVGDPSEPVRLIALVLLGRIGAPASEYLVSALDPDQPDGFRAPAAAVVGSIGPAAAACVRNLCRCLTSADDSLRGAASIALAKIGGPAVPALRRMLQFPNQETAVAALEALALIGRPAASAASEVEALSAGRYPRLRLACAAALFALTGDAHRGLPVLLQALEDPDPETRKTAAEKIGCLGKSAHPAVPDLLRRAADPDETVRAAAVLALGRINALPAQVVPAAISRLSDPAADVRYAAAVALSGFRADARSSLTALRALFKDPVEKVANCAAAADKIIEGTDS